MSDLRKLDLNLLILFDTIFSASSISRAAETLGLSQPTASNGLNRLRAHFDDPLFVREGRGVAPTVKARRLIGPVREALALLQGGLDDLVTFDPAEDDAHFVITIPSVVSTTGLPLILQRLMQAAPHVRLELLEQTWSDPWDVLLTDRSDLAIENVVERPAGVTLVPLVEVEHVVVASRACERYADGIDRAAFAAAAHVALPERAERRMPVAEALVQAGIERRIVCVASNGLELAGLVAQSELLGIMPRPWVAAMGERFGLRGFDLPFPCRRSQLYCGWKTRRENDARLRWLRETILSAARDYAPD